MRTLTLVWIQTNNTDAKRLGTAFFKYSLVSCLAVTLNHPIFNYINYYNCCFSTRSLQIVSIGIPNIIRQNLLHKIFTKRFN